MNFYEQTTFKDLPVFFKTLIVIGFLSTFIFIILLIIAISLMFESKIPKKVDLAEYDDFLNDFENGTFEDKEYIPEDQIKDQDQKIEYPDLPKIKDLQGNILKNLLQIDII